jgi:two-component system OmpR family response regulator
VTELLTVLYADDDDDIREVAEMALSAVSGLSVCVCGSGQEALELAPTCRPQLILLDVMMPGMDGPTTLAGLREDPDFAATPVVFLTAKIQPDEVARYKALGAIDVIGKPFDPMTLGDQLREIWARSQG